MKKRFIPTIIALVVLIVLALYSNKYEVEDIPKEGDVNPVFLVNSDEKNVKSISFGKNGKFEIKAELNSDVSKIVEPKAYDSDDAEVFGIARHFCELKSEFYFSDNATDTTIYGFNEQSPMVKIETATSTIELTLGNKIQVGDSYYLKKSGDKNVYIVPSHIKGSFEKSLNDLRNHALYKEDFGKCNEIEYKSTSENFKLVLDGKNSEWLIADSKYSADNVETANLINNMRNLRTSRFEDGEVNDEKYGFASSTLEIKIKNEFGKIFELKVGSSSGSDTYVTSDGKNVQVSNTSKVNDLRITFNDIRDKFLDIFPLKEITQIEVKDATGTIIIKKDKDSWLNDEKKIKEADIKDFINSLSRSKVTEYVEKQNLDAVGLSNPENCSKITLKTIDKELNYWLGDVKGVALFMMDEKEMIQISAEFSDAFTKFMHRVRATEVKVE